MHKLLKSSLATMMVCAALASPASAQELSESHLAAARAAINGISATAPYDQILPSLAGSLQERLIQNNPDLEAQITQFVEEETLKIAARRADLETEAARAYAKAFSEADLQAIADFYATDAGQALLRNAPVVTREVAEAANVWRRGIERDLVEAVGTRLREANIRAEVPADALAPATGEVAPAPAQ